ncbi:serine/arginine repetitive matrix protein 1-like [Apodemus sylvaticus]|uniref:serine/arginine repetitive matrix protein 1-like n=1 Tax=Apodemus sylvaticus TaxID=10129 RepID=UPI002243F7AF|nr:serine/arginine repetitive matrix protein 1-like [Apodemus sylvaticus]
MAGAGRRRRRPCRRPPPLPLQQQKRPRPGRRAAPAAAAAAAAAARGLSRSSALASPFPGSQRLRQPRRRRRRRQRRRRLSAPLPAGPAPAPSPAPRRPHAALSPPRRPQRRHTIGRYCPTCPNAPQRRPAHCAACPHPLGADRFVCLGLKVLVAPPGRELLGRGRCEYDGGDKVTAADPGRGGEERTVRSGNAHAKCMATILQPSRHEKLCPISLVAVTLVQSRGDPGPRERRFPWAIRLRPRRQCCWLRGPNRKATGFLDVGTAYLTSRVWIHRGRAHQLLTRNSFQPEETQRKSFRKCLKLTRLARPLPAGVANKG